MTIHPIRMTGLVIGVPQTFEYIEKMQERVVRFVTTHSHISEKMFKELMFKTGELNRDIGTAVGGNDAVKHGLIDAIGGIGDGLKKLNSLIELSRPAKTGVEGDYTMSHYTILPEEAYWEEAETAGLYNEIELGGVWMQVRMESGNRATIIRLLRCNLDDYLNPAYAPGKQIAFTPTLLG